MAEWTNAAALYPVTERSPRFESGRRLKTAYIMEQDEHRKGLLALKNGKRYVFTEGDYGKAEVWRINGALILYSIPMFGGTPVFEKAYDFGEYEDKRTDAIDEIVEVVDGWC